MAKSFGNFQNLARGNVNSRRAFGCVNFRDLLDEKHQVDLLRQSDAMMIPLSLTLGLGRITNFLNGELSGKPTNADWGVIFPHIDNVLRHPTQLYESIESFILAGILWFVWKKCGNFRGILTVVFLAGYGITRFVIEFWKMPYGENFAGFTTGQWLCLVMVGIAVWIKPPIPLIRGKIVEKK